MCIELQSGLSTRSDARQTDRKQRLWLQVTAAIVTCGGLCPGLNDVIANIVTTLEDYGVPDDRIYGIRYGLRGFVHRDSKPVNLNRALVDGIHLQGGTLLVRRRDRLSPLRLSVLQDSSMEDAKSADAIISIGCCHKQSMQLSQRCSTNSRMHVPGSMDTLRRRLQVGGLHHHLCIETSTQSPHAAFDCKALLHQQS